MDIRYQKIVMIIDNISTFLLMKKYTLFFQIN